MTAWTVSPAPYDSPEALALWRAYYTEVSDRWYELHQGHPTEPAELERQIVAADDGAGLLEPGGALLIARYDGEPAGCAGVRMLDAVTGELTRVFLLKRFRSRGGSSLLLTAVEERARALGASRVVLDTRGDLVEARALYALHGYEETPPANAKQYAEHWFAKAL